MESLSPERAEFERWSVESGMAYRNHQGFWFYRNGGDGLYEAWLAGYDKGCADAAAELRRLSDLRLSAYAAGKR